MSKTQKNVAVLIFDWVELVDMNGPIDVFLHANDYSPANFYNVYTVADTTAPIITEGRCVRIEPAYNLSTCPVPDIVVIPGIMNGDGKVGYASANMIAWIKQMGEAGKIILSVCIGAYTLAATGLLDGREATTHYASLIKFGEQYPKIHMVRNVRYQPSGNIVTTGGVTSGIDGALYLISILDSPAVAQSTADIMVYTINAPIPPGTLLPVVQASAQAQVL